MAAAPCTPRPTALSPLPSLPQGLLHENCGLLFVPLCLAMVNDASATCREMAALVLKALLGKLGPEKRDWLFGMVTSWFGARKVSVTAARVLGSRPAVRPGDQVPGG